MVHLLPLPGSPSSGPPLDQVTRRAVADAAAMAQGGVDGIIVENFGDAPFTAGRVDPYVVAAMTLVSARVRDVLPDGILGINVLRNDARAAMAIATAVAADFVRVNVHVGAMVTDQGLITGTARDTLLYRRSLDSGVRIAADVLVKHAVPLGQQSLVDSARDTHRRGKADALIVTGTGTGQPIDVRRLMAVRSATTAPVWAGSGVNPDTLPAVRPLVDAVIVGTYLHAGGDLDAPVDVARVRTMRDALHAD